MSEDVGDGEQVADVGVAGDVDRAVALRPPAQVEGAGVAAHEDGPVGPEEVGEGHGVERVRAVEGIVAPGRGVEDDVGGPDAEALAKRGVDAGDEDVVAGVAEGPHRTRHGVASTQARSAKGFCANIADQRVDCLTTAATSRGVRPRRPRAIRFSGVPCQVWRTNWSRRGRQPSSIQSLRTSRSAASRAASHAGVPTRTAMAPSGTSTPSRETDQVRRTPGKRAAISRSRAAGLQATVRPWKLSKNAARVGGRRRGRGARRPGRRPAGSPAIADLVVARGEASRVCRGLVRRASPGQDLLEPVEHLAPRALDAAASRLGIGQVDAVLGGVARLVGCEEDERARQGRRRRRRWRSSR